MSEPRTNSEILIKRIVVSEVHGTSTADVVSIPITPKCVRRFTLMQEDYIQLEFSLSSAVHIAIGDYFEDDLFGKFVCTEEQMPKYNTKTGGYDYSIRFDAEYMVWKNFIHCLTVNDSDNTLQRMESDWSLTDKLEVHAQQIADEVNLIIEASAPSPAYEGQIVPHSGYCIDITAERASEVHFLTYDGVNIIDALNMIAEAWGCEWWVTSGSTKVIDSKRYNKVIHFGKCENEGTDYDFRLGHNVESMDINRDQQTYANRIYAFGGTKNVPEDYDRKLEFVINEVGGNAGTNFHIQDTRFPLELNMINDIVDGVSTKTVTERNFSASSGNGLSIVHKLTNLAPDTYIVSGTMRVVLTKTRYSESDLSDTATIEVLDMGWDFKHNVPAGQNIELNTVYWETTFQFINHEVVLDERGDISFTVKVSGISGSNATLEVTGLKAKGTDKTASKKLEIVYNGNTYSAMLNAGHYAKHEDGYTYISNIKQGSTYLSGVSVGDKFSVPDKWIDKLAIPYSYYSPLYDTGVLRKVGERRIHLPSDPNGENNGKRYVETSGLDNYATIVEESVVFDDIFPRLLLKVASVTTENKVQEVVHDDESIDYQNWTQYKITATRLNGSEFHFDARYLMDGAGKLQAVFTAPATAQSNGFKLSGMTFDVGFDYNSQVYTIIRNEDFGAQIPNSYLYPSIDDEFFLTGWNPKAIGELGIIADAENELLNAAIAYRDAIQAGQFTFNCRMMSNWFFDLEADRFFVLPEEESEGNEPFFTVDENAFYVGNGFTRYRLPQAGDIVTVYHDALKDGSKTSRIIGYEFKLDKPYDTPTYVVGETEAFSRLKQIEKKLTKL